MKFYIKIREAPLSKNERIILLNLAFYSIEVPCQCYYIYKDEAVYGRYNPSTGNAAIIVSVDILKWLTRRYITLPNFRKNIYLQYLDQSNKIITIRNNKDYRNILWH